METAIIQESLTVLQLNQRLSDAIATTPGLRNVWVVGETSDLRVSGGHCYMELVEKADNGTNLSRIRGIIWANAFSRLNARFREVTGIDLGSGIKIRVCVTASYHPTYGMSVNITAIDPAYTAGDAVRRRNEILERLTREGIIELNRHRPWPVAPNRIAVISAPGAAGYGDFVTHLFGNPFCLRFSVDLFAAVMQGERTVPSVLEALDAIEDRADLFDAVVLIRGGGSTTDLAAFDNYDLAARIARFPLPVIVGIGHERDITVLDYVASERVKTPTAAAEKLIERVARVLEALGRAADKIYRSAAERIGTHREFLAYASASLPGIASGLLMRRHNELERHAMTMATTVSRTVTSRNERLNRYAADISSAATLNLERQAARISRCDDLLKVLSPDAVLARGFSLTLLPDGSVLRHAGTVPAGTELTTRLSQGSIRSVVTEHKDL